MNLSVRCRVKYSERICKSYCIVVIVFGRNVSVGRLKSFGNTYVKSCAKSCVVEGVSKFASCNICVGVVCLLGAGR